MSEATQLAQSRSASMIAAAGCGKTHVIARAIADHGGFRELVLTHTHAGVDAIRTRLREFDVDRLSFHVDTIAGWSLRLATAFPVTSRLEKARPRSNDDYRAVYAAAAEVLRLDPLQKMIKASYSGIYVDEYQDCTIEQHELVLKLEHILPSRVLGDPLQGIFGFGNNTPVQWKKDVATVLTPLRGPITPWRWKNTNPDLGLWLQQARADIENGNRLDLRSAPVTWIDSNNSQEVINACFRRSRTDGDSIIVICQWPNQARTTASRLRGRFSCIEAIESNDLFDFAKELDQSEGFGRAYATLSFASKCMTKVGPEMRSAERAFLDGRPSRMRKHQEQVAALTEVAENHSLEAVKDALQSLRKIPDCCVYRYEVLRELMRAIGLVTAGDAKSMHDAAWLVRNRTRRIGRSLARCSVGTTLLVKGLQFDHAIVVGADDFDASNLYVALTRGSKSLTIASRSRSLTPSKAA